LLDAAALSRAVLAGDLPDESARRLRQHLSGPRRRLEHPAGRREPDLVLARRQRRGAGAGEPVAEGEEARASANEPSGPVMSRPSAGTAEGRTRDYERYAVFAAIVLLLIGCYLVVRPFLTAFLWGGILSLSTRRLYEKLRGLLGGRKRLAATLAGLTIAA